MILLGIGYLAKRWNYIRQGVYEKMQYDSEFLRPIAIINTKVGLNPIKVRIYQ